MMITTRIVMMTSFQPVIIKCRVIAVVTFFFRALLMTLLMHACAGQSTCPLDKVCNPQPVELLDLTTYSEYRSIDVSSTCGVPNNTTYQKLSSTLDDTQFICQDKDHPKVDMADWELKETSTGYMYNSPNLNTYWQSENMIPTTSSSPIRQSVTINLGNPFLIREIKIIFIAPHINDSSSNADGRSRCTMIEAKTFNDSSFLPWRYYAYSCPDCFQLTESSAQSTGPVCISKYYGGDTDTLTGFGYGWQELLYFTEYSMSAEQQRNSMASSIRVVMSVPADDTPLSSYIAIASVQVTGHCACFGHAAQCKTMPPNGHHCECAHNTAGANCEECLPLFNNRTWAMGIEGNPNPCESCGCNEKYSMATICHYDSGKGYGVCDDCGKQTMGDKCEFCVDFYYVNPLRDEYANGLEVPTRPCTGFNGTVEESYECNKWCIPCDCDVDGTVESSMFNCDNYTGQCECKTNVQGRNCNECKDGFWNMRADNPLGCQMCVCDDSGTIDNFCDKMSGDCKCKNNTQGVSCSQCKAGFYNLDSSNPEGCTPCDCDMGGATSTTCPPDTGQCPCLTDIGGLTCNEPILGTFVPLLDYITLEAEFAPNVSRFTLTEETGHGELGSSVTGWGLLQLPPNSEIDLEFSAPKSWKYTATLRYRSLVSWTAVQLVVEPIDLQYVMDQTFTCDGSGVRIADPQTLSADIAASTESGTIDFGDVCLYQHNLLRYRATLKLNTPSTSGDISVDALALLPVINKLSVYANADATTKSAIETCRNLAKGVNPDERAQQQCYDYDYSVMAEFFNGARSCDCSNTGSTSGVCAGVGGQCPCRGGVITLDCGNCKVDHYGFGSGNGCTACGCNVNGSMRISCTDAGLCECRPNVQGDKCDSCIAEHYGLYTGNGCTPCQCNGNYSLDNSCADSGQCNCKPGIGNLECDTCMEGFFNLTTDGCMACMCNEYGSVGAGCVEDTGVCTCKQRVEGEKCDTCKEGYFSLGDLHEEGCLECYCSGHASQCTVAPDWHKIVQNSSWNLLDANSAVEGRWTGVNGEGTAIEVDDPTIIIDNTAEHVMRVENTGDNVQYDDLFLVATSNYLGDKRAAYGQKFSVSLVFTVPAGANYTLLPRSPKGDIILKGNYTDFHLVAPLPEYPIEVKKTFEFPFVPAAWTVNTTDGDSATHTQLIQTLTSLELIWVRAKFSNVTGAIVDMHAAILFYGRQDTSLTTPVLMNVEECSCEAAYTGSYCELCASGYRRAVVGSGAFADCVLCDCNGHESAVGPCDPETGVCNCTDNTYGDHCEFCLEGFYGDATTGPCTGCLCPGSVVDGAINAFASGCVPTENGEHRCVNCTDGHLGNRCEICQTNHYGTPTNVSFNGGRCLPCECNGRADTCDRDTGICINCVNNTGGKECDICGFGYFGNANQNDCNPCYCTSIGSTGGCNPSTGQCECKPNVEGFNCTVCALYSYNYTSGEGCSECACHDQGASGISCDIDTGQCDCKSRVAGRACDLCEDAYYDLTSAGCIPCGCNNLGTANIPGDTFGTCELESGQCQCNLPGITGRTCDQCAPGTKEEYIFVSGDFNGQFPNCELCGECYDNWAAKLDSVGLDIADAHNRALKIWSNHDNLTYAEVAPLLEELNANLTSVEASLMNTAGLLEYLSYLQEGFQWVMNHANDYASEKNVLEAEVDRVRASFSSSQQYSGHVDLYNSTEDSTTIQATSQLAFNTSAYHDQLLMDSTLAYNSIENRTNVLQQSNGSAQLLRENVDESLALLAIAKQGRLATEEILNGTFSTEYTRTVSKLAEIEDDVDGYSTDSVTVMTNLESVRTDTTAALVDIEQAEDLTDTELEEMTTNNQQAQTALTEVNRGLAQAVQAESSCGSFKDIGVNTKAKMTQVLVDTVNGLRDIENVNADVAQGKITANAALSMTVVDKSVIDQLQQSIVDTTLPADRVASVATSANQALQVADEALSITQQAAANSSETLAQIQEVNSNLDSANMLRAQAEMDHSAAQDAVNNVQLVINATNAKAASTAAVGLSTKDAVDDIGERVADITTGYTTAQSRAATLATESQATENLAQQVSEEHDANQNSYNGIVTPISQKRVAIEGELTSLQAIANDLDALEEDLEALNDIQDLSTMQSEYSNSRRVLTELQAQIAQLDGEISILLNNLAFLKPDSTTCTKN